MRYYITSRGDSLSEELKDDIIKKLTNFSFIYDEDQPELVLSIGGDGTLLKAFHHFEHRLKDTAFLGIHTGHLGFYADWTPKEMDQLIDYITTTTPYPIVEYPLLEVSIEYEDTTEVKTFLALNEFTVKSTNSTLVMDVMIRKDYFETFRGDGLCVSTPSGSTAYNKALGGAIIHPTIQAIQLTEMASINNRVFRTIGSSLLLPAAHPLVLKPVDNTPLHFTIDHIHLNESIKSFQCRVANEHIRFVRFRSFPFWKRVKDSFVTD